MNRLDQQHGPDEARPAAGDYFLVVTEDSTWYVSTVIAQFIEVCLDDEPRPQWVKFVDLSGSRVRLRLKDIEYICQCTAEQRSAERVFFHALKQERKADRFWDDDA